MRSFKTFILHFYTDTESRNQICGELRALPRRKKYSFKNGSELLLLVHRLVNEESDEVPFKEALDENDSDLG